ncbi:unnamed protein product [marine sediment metagenome]|uniref:RRM domain-containing protein n=1 Tax=marine sediment metagenome TaxID=412755 RepID=X1EY45_9ZZZZ
MIKSTIIYANNEEEARDTVQAKYGKVTKIECLGLNHMKNPYYRVTYRPI